MTTTSTYCSKRLGELDHGKLQTALDRMRLGKLKGVTPITAGNFGQNVFISADTGEYVFRGCPHYAWQFPKERRFARLLNEATEVPVPWPYLLDPDAALFGWPYVIMPRMPGLELNDECSSQAIGHNDWLGIAEAMGRALAGLQSLTHEFCGEYDVYTDDFKPFGCSHLEYVRSRLLTDVDAANETLTPSDREWVKSLLDDAEAALAVGFEPVFVMQDFKGGNLVVQRTNGRWDVSGVFDFMEPFFADGEMDLCRNLCCHIESGNPQLAAAFVSAYANARPMREGCLARFPVYLLLDRIIIWNFGWRHGRPWWDQRLSFRDWIDLDTMMETFQQSLRGDA